MSEPENVLELSQPEDDARAGGRADAEGAAGTQDDGDDNLDVEEVMRGRGGKPELIDWKTPSIDPYVMEWDKVLPLTELGYDEAGVQGQARELNLALVKKRKKELKANPPIKPVEPVVWQEAIGVPLVYRIPCA
jgi:hypothetical protein